MATLEMTTLQPPLRITQLLHSGWAMEALRAGVHLDVFGKLAAKPRSAGQLAEEISADPKACELLLNALVSLEFLEKKNGVYETTELSRHYLVSDSNLYLGSYVTDDRVSRAWVNLKDVIKTGKPVHTVNTEEKAEEFFPALAASIFPLNYGSAHSVATELRIEHLPAGAKVLDIAAGSGVWSLPLAERNKDLRVDALDFPAVLEVTKRFAAQHGVAERYTYISGNWSDCQLAAESYDLVLLGHILHSEGKSRSEALLKESHRCLKKGGRLVIAEMISDNERIAAPFAQIFALNMLIMTENGCVFSEGELQAMLSQLGFSEIKRPSLPYWGDDSPVMIATK